MDRLDGMVSNLGLQKVKQTKVGSATERGLSGGEVKRASIANESLAMPRIFFLDVETAHPAAIGLWCLQFVWLLACMVTPAGRATFEFVLMGRGRKLGVAWLVSHFAAMALLTAALCVPDDA